MKYGDIYSSDFLNKFGSCQDSISSILLDEGKAQYEIDVASIAKHCDISIEYSSVEHSSHDMWDNFSKRNLIVNQLHPEYKQRIDIARGIGHIVLNHKMDRYDKHVFNKYAETIQRIYNVASDDFAIKLLMPEKLIKMALRDSINRLGYSIDLSFGNVDVARIIDLSASLFNVSTQQLNSRLNDLQIFVDGE